jgi:FkbM family methyltransferase
LISLLRRLRHGPLLFMSPIWIVLGSCFRFVVGNLRWVSVTHKIGKYGPFKMDGEFSFSDFEHWGGGHNNGFEVCVDSAKNAECFLDVGGHIGLVTMPVAGVISATGTVHTFEPAEANLKHLNSHIQKNKITNVFVIESLVGDVDEENVGFYEQPSATGQNALAVKKDHYKYKKTIRNQISLDSYCEVNSLSPDIIKIDVEGAEWFVLNGARKILKKYKPKIFLSLHPVELTLLGKSVDSVINIINEVGYDVYNIDGTKVTNFKLEEYLLLPCEEESEV